MLRSVWLIGPCFYGGFDLSNIMTEGYPKGCLDVFSDFSEKASDLMKKLLSLRVREARFKVKNSVLLAAGSDKGYYILHTARFTGLQPFH